jgi:hypothetical protein
MLPLSRVNKWFIVVGIHFVFKGIYGLGFLSELGFPAFLRSYLDCDNKENAHI